MKIRALRGVCIGPARHLKPGDTEDLEPALVTFLVGIGAVERVADEVPPPQAQSTESAPDKKPGKKEK